MTSNLSGSSATTGTWVLILGAVPAVIVGVALTVVGIGFAIVSTRPPLGIADLGHAFALFLTIVTLPGGVVTLVLLVLSRISSRPILVLGIAGNLILGVLWVGVVLAIAVSQQQIGSGLLNSLPGWLFILTGLTALVGWSLRGMLSPGWVRGAVIGTIVVIGGSVLLGLAYGIYIRQGRIILTGHDGVVHAVAWSPNGQLIASGDRDGRVLLWNSDETEPVRTLIELPHTVENLAWSPDSARLAISSGNDAIVVAADTGRELLRLAGHTSLVNSLDWSPDGDRLVTASIAKVIMVWDANTGERQHLLTFEQGGVGQEVAWSPDGSTLAYAVGGGHLLLWDADTGEQVQAWIVRGRMGPLAWSPDGTRLAFHEIGAVAVLDAATGDVIQVLKGSRDNLETIAWSSDGTRLAAGSFDGTVYVWNVSSGRQTNAFHGHDGSVWSVAWSPDGKQLVSGSTDTQVIVWHVE